MSAWEYEAPTTMPDSRPEVLGCSRSRSRWLGGLQKGDVELSGPGLAGRWNEPGGGGGGCGTGGLTLNGLKTWTGPVSNGHRLGIEERPCQGMAMHSPTWTISFRAVG